MFTTCSVCVISATGVLFTFSDSSSLYFTSFSNLFKSYRDSVCLWQVLRHSIELCLPPSVKLTVIWMLDVESRVKPDKSKHTLWFQNKSVKKERGDKGLKSLFEKEGKGEIWSWNHSSRGTETLREHSLTPRSHYYANKVLSLPSVALKRLL